MYFNAENNKRGLLLCFQELFFKNFMDSRAHVLMCTLRAFTIHFQIQFLRSKQYISSFGKKFLLTTLIMILSGISYADSTPPPLPPALPQLANDKIDNHPQQKKDSDSLLNKIPELPKSSSTEPTPISVPQVDNQSNNDTDSFIDLGNNKLPTLPTENNSSTLNNDLDNKKLDNLIESKQSEQTPIHTPKVELNQSNKPDDNNKSPLNEPLADNQSKQQIVDPITPVIIPEEKSKATIVSDKPHTIAITPKDSSKTNLPQNHIPVPVFVKKNDEPEKSNKVPEQNTLNAIEEQLDKSIVITKNEINNHKELLPNPEIAQFVQDETAMLFLPNDDIISGEITQQARLEQMDIYSYVQIFKQIYDRNSRVKQKKIIDKFINNYDYNFHIRNSRTN